MEKATRKLIGVTMLLNFIMLGLGHWYLGLRKKAVKIFVTSVSILILCIIGIPLWLFLPLICFSLGLWCYTMIWSVVDTKKHRQPSVMKWDKLGFYLLILSIWIVITNQLSKESVAKNFAIRTFRIPTSSMANTLKVGDYVIALRTKNVDLQDVVVFKYPPDPESIYIKRCMAKGGDTLSVKDGLVVVNGKVEPGNKQLKFYTIISYSDIRQIEQVPVLLNWNEHIENQLNTKSLPDFGTWAGRLSLAEVDLLKREIPALKFNQIKMRDPEDLFPNGKQWSIDFYGPIVIPKKGMKVNLLEDNINTYFKSVVHENPEWDLCLETEGIYKNCSEKLESYTFKMDYYFVMGDNRHNSADSRMWGFVPEDLVYGVLWKVF